MHSARLGVATWPVNITMLRYYLWELVSSSQAQDGGGDDDDKATVTFKAEPVCSETGPANSLKASFRSVLHAKIGEDLHVKLGLIRVPSVKADILISLNCRTEDQPIDFDLIFESVKMQSWDLFEC